VIVKGENSKRTEGYATRGLGKASCVGQRATAAVLFLGVVLAKGLEKGCVKRHGHKIDEFAGVLKLQRGRGGWPGTQHVAPRSKNARGEKS